MPEGTEKYLLPFGFLATFVLLLLNKNNPQAVKSISSMQIKDALIVGAVQGLAIIPGLSRSGSTVSALRFSGYGREESGEYSFLLSVPVILGGAAADVLRQSYTGNHFFGRNASRLRE